MRLWNNIISLKRAYGNGNWFIVGDINAVLVPEERRGMRVDSTLTSKMRRFKVFIVDLEVIDIPLLGRRFTWYNANEMTVSRIDRVLVSAEWLEMWRGSTLWVGPRDVSDHCPLILKNSSND
jgi:exonuclease III